MPVRRLVPALSVVVLLACSGVASARTIGAGVLNGNPEPPPLEHCPQGDATILGGYQHDIGLEGTGVGVLTKFRTVNIGRPGAQIIFRVARYVEGSSAGGVFSMIGSAPATLDANGSAEVAARIPVRNTDRLALTKAAGAQVACEIPIQGENEGVGEAEGLLPDGARSAFKAVRDRYLAIAALIETDDDQDGWGDDTQDKCPGQAGPNDGCVTDPLPEAGSACTVPRLIGLKLAAAKRRLAAAGCTLGTIRRLAAGRNLVVRRQSRAPGSQAAAGAKVNLKLGRRRS